MAPTRFNTLNNTGTTIDRIFVNTAPCFLKQCKWAASILDDPKKLYTSGISDHGMVQAKACFSSATAPGEGVIPPPYLQNSTFHILSSNWRTKTGSDLLRIRGNRRNTLLG